MGFAFPVFFRWVSGCGRSSRGVQLVVFGIVKLVMNSGVPAVLQLCGNGLIPGISSCNLHLLVIPLQLLLLRSLVCLLRSPPGEQR